DADHHRPVPRADRTDDAEGPVVELGGGAAVVVDEDLGLEEEGGGRAQPGGTGADLEAGVGAVERLALLAGEELGEGLGVGLDGVGRAAEQLAALLVAAGGPLRLDPTGRRDGGV